MKSLQMKSIRMKSIQMKNIWTESIRIITIIINSIPAENSIEWKTDFNCIFSKIKWKVKPTKLKM